VIERENAKGFIAGFMSGFTGLLLEPLDIRPIVNPYPDIPDNRLNDAKADSHGRIWAGSMPFGADRPSGNLYRLDPDRRLYVMDRGYHVANGPAISPDQRWLYHTDTVPGLVYRFALQADGALGPREIFIAFEKEWGRPDGMTVDAEGHLWIAHWNGAQVSRYTPEGRRIRSIALPARQVTNVCFAGAKLDRMFVTSAADGGLAAPHGGLFEILDPGVTGVAPGRFGG
jgi:D-xylonolactonase